MEEINGNEIEGAEKENKDDEKSLSAIKEEVIVENKKIETNSERDKGTVKVSKIMAAPFKDMAKMKFLIISFSLAGARNGNDS